MLRESHTIAVRHDWYPVTASAGGVRVRTVSIGRLTYSSGVVIVERWYTSPSSDDWEEGLSANTELGVSDPLNRSISSNRLTRWWCLAQWDLIAPTWSFLVLDLPLLSVCTQKNFWHWEDAISPHSIVVVQRIRWRSRDIASVLPSALSTPLSEIDTTRFIVYRRIRD